jgi:hypothetical protein
VGAGRRRPSRHAAGQEFFALSLIRRLLQHCRGGQCRYSPAPPAVGDGDPGRAKPRWPTPLPTNCGWGRCSNGRSLPRSTWSMPSTATMRSPACKTPSSTKPANLTRSKVLPRLKKRAAGRLPPARPRGHRLFALPAASGAAHRRDR